MRWELNRLAALCIAVCLLLGPALAGAAETKLTASDGATGDHYGRSVAASGDLIVVGAYFDDDNEEDSGSVYVYRRDGATWNETKLTASDGATDDYYGFSVAVSGDVVVVGAHRDDDDGSNSGSAYVYRWDGIAWNETKLTASDGAAGDEYGIKVGASGDVVVVGAWRDDDGSGSAYVYRWDGITWNETKLTASDGAVQDRYGISVAASGEVVVVGAYQDDDNGTDSGSAYVYRCQPDTPGEAETVRVETRDAATGDLTLTYQPACSATDHSVVFGLLESVKTYQYSGRECRIGVTGRFEWFNPGSGSYFFLVTGTDDQEREGSYGRVGGVERPSFDGDPLCPFVQDLCAPCN